MWSTCWQGRMKWHILHTSCNTLLSIWCPVCHTRHLINAAAVTRFTLTILNTNKVKVKFSLLVSVVGPGANPTVQAVSPRVTFKSSPSGRLPLLSARPVVTLPAEERHHPLTSTKLYCLVTEAYRCEQLAQGCYAASSWWELNPRPNDRKFNALLQYNCTTLNPKYWQVVMT